MQTLARARSTIPQSLTMPAAGSKRVEGEWLTPEEYAIYAAVRRLTPKEAHGQSPKKKQKTLALTPTPSTTLAVPALIAEQKVSAPSVKSGVSSAVEVVAAKAAKRAAAEMQGKGALPGAARLCVRAETRRAKEKTWRAWLWCNLKPRNLPWCATVLLAALFLSGHGGVLHEVGVFMGILNGVAAEAVASVSEASKLAINGSKQFLLGGAEVLSTSSLLLRSMYDGVDLANVTARRRHGRFLAASEEEARLWLRNHSDAACLPSEFNEAALRTVLQVTKGIPAIEAGDEFVNFDAGQYWSWATRARLADKERIAFAFYITTVKFDAQWANAVWSWAECSLSTSTPQVLAALRDFQRGVEAVPADEWASDDGFVGRKATPGANWRGWAGLALGLLVALAAWRREVLAIFFCALIRTP